MLINLSELFPVEGNPKPIQFRWKMTYKDLMVLIKELWKKNR